MAPSFKNYNCMKIRTFTFFALLASFVLAPAQTFQKGDKVITAAGNIGMFDTPDDMKLGYGGKISFEYGVADGLFGGKGSIGIGITATDLYGGTYEGVNIGSYNYNYTSVTYSRMKTPGSSRYYIEEMTGTHHREGEGSAKCDVNRNDATLLATVSLHYQFMDKLDTYFSVGGGATYVKRFFSNYHNAIGMSKEDHIRQKPSVSNYDGPVVSYAYDDFAHAKWQGGGSKVYPAINASVGARYYITNHWAVSAEVGLNAFTIKKNINAMTLGSIGACYKF